MEERKKTIQGKITYFLTLIFLLILLYFAYQYYQTNNFNDFVRSETNLYTSEFKRDNEVKYLGQRSYRITSQEYNDAMFYKTIEVEKNHAYKVSCMIKTEEVIAEDSKTGVGAQISIEGTTERSVAIQGNTEWQKIELIFNSKDREEINIGFRLGGYLGKAKGQAWFSDLKLEEGTVEQDNEWKFACFIFKTTDVNINNKEVKLNVTNSDIKDIKDTIRRFAASCKNLSEEKMTAEYDIYEIDTPITQLSYDNQFAYYVSPENIEEQIRETISNGDYDHIFAILRLRR